MLSKLTNYLLHNQIEYKMDIPSRVIKVSSDIYLSQAETIKAMCGEPFDMGEKYLWYNLDPILFEI